MPRKPAIAVYCDHLLPFSQTFVILQGEALQHFTPYYVGSRIVKGLSLPNERTLVVNSGGALGSVKEILYKIWGVAPTLYRHVKQLEPVLLHAHFGVGGALALPLKHQLKVPMLITFHGFEVTVKDEYAQRSFYGHRVYLRHREALKSEAHLLIAVSDFIKRKLIEWGFSADKVVVHYIGVDTETFQPDPSVQREPIVLFVGRLVEKKGCEYLIQAMSSVQVARPEVELVVIGDGPLRLSCEQLAKTILRRCRFLGVQSAESVRNWMNRAKIFSVPSVTAESGDSEAFGIVFAEAQAMGLPVVSFISGGIPEAVAHGETGFLVAERDCEGLSKNIMHLLEDETLWQQFSQNGQQRVRALFSLRKQTKALEEIYKKVLSEQGIS